MRAIHHRRIYLNLNMPNLVLTEYFITVVAFGLPTYLTSFSFFTALALSVWTLPYIDCLLPDRGVLATDAMLSWLRSSLCWDSGRSVCWEIACFVLLRTHNKRFIQSQKKSRPCIFLQHWEQRECCVLSAEGMVADTQRDSFDGGLIRIRGSEAVFPALGRSDRQGWQSVAFYMWFAFYCHKSAPQHGTRQHNTLEQQSVLCWVLTVTREMDILYVSACGTGSDRCCLVCFTP